MIVTADQVVTPGPTSADFNYYTFDGGLVKQRNTGVVWLTGYTDKATENASAVKIEYVRGGRFLVLWEKWTSSAPVATYAQLVDKNGTKISTQIDFGGGVRLPRTDRIQFVGGKYLWLTGNGHDLELNVLTVAK